MTNAYTSLNNIPNSMVSQPYSGEQTLAVRRPPSVSSRSTTARRHRGNRSHHGGSTYTSQNEFPNFAHTGDVEIIVNYEGQEKRYMLHRLILSQCSGFFEASTSEEWSRTQSQPQNSVQESERLLTRIGEEEDSRSQVGGPVVPATHQGHRSRWRYELDPANQQDEIPMLVQKVRLKAQNIKPTVLRELRSHYHPLCSAVTALLYHHLRVTSLLHLQTDFSGRFQPCNLLFIYLSLVLNTIQTTI